LALLVERRALDVPLLRAVPVVLRALLVLRAELARAVPERAVVLRAVDRFAPPLLRLVDLPGVSFP
jgi:hypothetical protein